MQDLRVTGDRTDLEELREELYAKIPGIDLQEINETKPGELGEPFLIALLIALGGAEITRKVAEVIIRWMEHRETMAKLRELGLSLEESGKIKSIRVEELLDPLK